MSTIQISNENLFKDALCDLIIKSDKEEPHSGLGWSGIGYCLGMQTLDYELKCPFDGTGRTVPGKIFHKYIQETLKSGMRICGDRYLVVGHEQAVQMFINDQFRVSFVDTVLWDIIEKHFVYIDWKSAAFAKYNENKPKDAHIDQLNLYCYLGGATEGIIIYVDKKDILEMYPCKFTVDTERAKNTISRMMYLEDIKNKKIEYKWSDLAEGVKKDPAKSDCNWCKHKDSKACLQRFNQQFGKDYRSLNGVHKELYPDGDAEITTKN